MASFQEVVHHDEAAREFVEQALRTWTGLNGKRYSVAAMVAFLAIGRGMRLVIPTGRAARLAPDPTFRFVGVEPIPIPYAIAQEMIDSGLMKKLDYSGGDWWCMIQ